MKALVLGAEGTLGRALCDFLPSSDGGAWEVEALGRSQCDITDATAVLRTVRSAQPDAVFNSAAYTNVDRAEDEPDLAFRVNALGPENIALACKSMGVSLIHYSTDFVFDGKVDRAYDEFDAPTPLGVYARSKVAGEKLAAAASERVFIIRVGWLYGRGGGNFPSTIARRLAAGETIRADSERVGAPTWVRNVAEVSVALAYSEFFGLYHCTSTGETTWEEYARFLAKEMGLPNAEVIGQSSASLPSMKAPRPRRAVLDNRMLRLRGLDTMPDWRDAARAFVRAERQVR
jgi:dTDP-4-dehydrorhamnose reductase